MKKLLNTSTTIPNFFKKNSLILRAWLLDLKSNSLKNPLNNSLCNSLNNPLNNSLNFLRKTLAKILIFSFFCGEMHLALAQEAVVSKTDNKPNKLPVKNSYQANSQSTNSSFLKKPLVISKNNQQSTEKNNFDQQLTKNVENNKIISMPELLVIANSNDQQNSNYFNSRSRSSLRNNTALIDTPQSISVVNQQQIKEQNITNMEQAVRYVPSFNIQQGEGHRDQLTIRGNSTNADFFVDSARDDLQYLRDFYNVENIEFLRGPNALSFGRGGAGGLVNRINKYADGKKQLAFNLTYGSFNDQRIAVDVGDKVSEKFSLRLNSMYEKSRSFRRFSDFERYAINPTLTINFAKNTNLKLSYEHFSDQRVVDRGVPSQNNQMLTTNAKSFFGNPFESYAITRINNLTAIFEHQFDKNSQLRNLTRFSQNYKFYQNIYPSSAVNTNNNFNISAYNNLTTRDNFTNQIDYTKKLTLLNFKHNLLIGNEITRQDSINLRKNSLFNNASSLSINAGSPIDNSPLNFIRQASVNDLISEVRVVGLYLQDQIDLHKKLQLILGVRQDRFEVNIRNNHSLQKFSRIDNLTSPRLGLVFKANEQVSLYSSYSVSYLPSVGDQFDTLDSQLKNFKPEKLQNYEIGSKVEINNKFSFNTAIFELQRSNSKANDPSNAGFYLLTGETRTRGFEFEAKGKITQNLQTILGYTWQDAKVVSPTAISSTSATRKNSKVALAPNHKLAWWNKYNFNQQLALAVGVIRQSSQYASADNTVKLKGFKRFDIAGFYKIDKNYDLQLNIENLFNERYALTAHNNNNISPGSIRAVRLTLNTKF
ncbi:MAG: TonB-dependent receptor [Alphaproteobacteria bacterium]